MTSIPACLPFRAQLTPAMSPPPPTGATIDIQRRILGQNLQTEGALSGDHRFVIERVDKCRLRLQAPFDGAFIGLIVRGPMQHDLRAMGARGGQLDHRCRARHPDLGWDTAPGGMIGNPLPMVPCRGRYHAAPLLVVGHRQDAVQCAAFLERARHLQILELQIDRIACQVGQHFRVHQRSLVDRRFDPAGCRFDMFKIQHAHSFFSVPFS